MRKRWLVVGAVGYIVLVAICVLVGSWRNRLPPTEPLSLRTVTWQEVGMMKGIVDEEVVARASCP
ncbi:MAG: hypothetical protein ACK40X_07240 [Armatimonadota bacterium]